MLSPLISLCVLSFVQIGVIAGIFHFFSRAIVFIPFIFFYPINDPLWDFFVVVCFVIYLFLFCCKLSVGQRRSHTSGSNEPLETDARPF